MKFYKKSVIFMATVLSLQSILAAATLKEVKVNNTLMVSIRTISDDLGMQVYYQPETKAIYINDGEQRLILQIGNKHAVFNNQPMAMEEAPKIIDGTAYVPIRYIGETLGGKVELGEKQLKVTLGDKVAEWTLEKAASIPNAPVKLNGKPFQMIKKQVYGKRITAVKINMNDQHVKPSVVTAGGKISKAASLKTMAKGAKAAINGGYFAAYNGAIPYPDGTIVRNGRALHISDIGSTIGFTSDHKVLIDFVTTRVQGYVNDELVWQSYRVNRAATDGKSIVIYTPEYDKTVRIPKGCVAVVVIKGQVVKYALTNRKVPQNGFLLVMNSSHQSKFQIGDQVSLKTVYTPENTNQSDWDNVQYALSGGPSLMINGKITGNPADESFTEAKILRNPAQRTFIGVDGSNQVWIGTTTATIKELKNICRKMGLVSAMCVDGGASSGLYYEGRYLTTPGRNVNNCISFYYK